MVAFASMITILDLKPAIFSKATNVAIFRTKLAKAPKQVPNSKEAFEGHVMEFILNDGPDFGQPVGTLFEFVQELPDVDIFVIHFRNGDSTIVVKNGNSFQEQK